MAAGFRQALDDIFSQALAAQYPDHPEFGVEVKRSALRHVLEVMEHAVADPEERVEVPRNVRDEVRGIGTPLGLGDMGETHFKLGRRWVDELDRKRAQHGGDSLSVGELRVVDRGARAARSAARGPELGDHDVRGAKRDTASPSLERRRPRRSTRLDDEWELEAQALPAAGDYERAVQRAGGGVRSRGVAAAERPQRE